MRFISRGRYVKIFSKYNLNSLSKIEYLWNVVSVVIDSKFRFDDSKNDLMNEEEFQNFIF